MTTNEHHIPSSHDSLVAATAVCKVLDELGINYVEVEHQPLFTVDDARNVQMQIAGQGCKSILLRTKKRDRYLLVLLREDRRANTQAIASQVNCSHLSFANADELAKLLGLYPGAVSPFGIINDTENRVELLIDPCLVGQRLLFHPNTNTRTVSIAYDDLIKFIESRKHSYTLLN